MATSYVKLDQALKDLIEAYMELEHELDEKHGEEEENYSAAIIETLETSIENAIEDQDSSTSLFASMLSHLYESLEQLDPSAFEDEDATYEIEDVDYELEEGDEDEELDIEEDDENE